MAGKNLDVALRTLGAEIGQSAITRALHEQAKADDAETIERLRETISTLEDALSKANEKIARLTDAGGEPVQGEVLPDGY